MVGGENPEMFKNTLSSLISVFECGMKDPQSEKVRLRSLEGISLTIATIGHNKRNLAHFQRLAPLTMNVY